MSFLWGQAATSCVGHFDCVTSGDKSFCCAESGNCCTEDKYMMGAKSCETNLDCPTEADFYYCCVSTQKCCSYDDYKVSKAKMMGRSFLY